MLGVIFLTIIPIVIFFVLFIIIALLVFIIRFIIYKITKKKISLYWYFSSLIIPILCVFVYGRIIDGGISFKFIDPQYYEFKKLCENADSKTIIYNQDLYRIYNERKDKEVYYDKITQKKYFIKDFNMDKTFISKLGKLSINKNMLSYKEQPVYEYSSYWYKETGIFLSGDAGAGFGLKDNQTLYCKDRLIEIRR